MSVSKLSELLLKIGTRFGWLNIRYKEKWIMDGWIEDINLFSEKVECKYKVEFGKIPLL